jgi:N-acyl homoserine lactone hydrolase
MAKLKIHRLPLAKLVHEYPQPMYMSRILEPSFMYAYIFYIEGPKQKILIDAGLSTENMFKLKLPGEHVAFPAEALKKVGLKPDDIDLVIFTHMHFDHSDQSHLFKKARFIVQKSELKAALNPHPIEAPVYGDKKAYEDLDFEVIDGDAQVVDGIKLLLTPGHTSGGQSVMIDTAKGKVIISGLCTSRNNFYPQAIDPRSMPVIPPSMHVNVHDAYDSLLRIKKEADIIIPLHDASGEYEILA